MRPSGPEVSDVFRALQPKLSELCLSPDKSRIFRSIISCRTASAGAHRELHCDSCGYTEQAYNSCWNRHCPKCRGGDVFGWVRDRLNDLLPVPYFHVVFTLPSELRELVYANKRLLYDAFFAASSETLLTVARNNLLLSLGFFGVLHTWNQELQYHPHIHYLVPGGGLHTDTVAVRPESRSVSSPSACLGSRLLRQVHRAAKGSLPLGAALPAATVSERPWGL